MGRGDGGASAGGLEGLGGRGVGGAGGAGGNFPGGEGATSCPGVRRPRRRREGRSREVGREPVGEWSTPTAGSQRPVDGSEWPGGGGWTPSGRGGRALPTGKHGGDFLPGGGSEAPPGQGSETGPFRLDRAAMPPTGHLLGACTSSIIFIPRLLPCSCYSILPEYLLTGGPPPQDRVAMHPGQGSGPHPGAA